ncbi:uncharacterized protein LOC124923911 [Impatiens glandulifera]|uniref:uncharacterized protein LOC124923911 n=1 Tax=Impatiens glandulifera TaxID=253017 RepID=UPI001FB1364F|nr:uncharacterized protein LOC124923911 [Impatiens glandulifera]
MDFFTKSKPVITIRSYHDKYLVADDDRKTVRQSKNGSSMKARWHVEFTKSTEPTSIRLRSCHGRYLAASSTYFLLGMTGNKVIQADSLEFVDWQPIRDGFSLKFRSAACGTLLRGNGGPPPWKNSVTHDEPKLKSDWVLWQVEEVDDVQDLSGKYLSLLSSVSSVSDDLFGGSDIGSPVSVQSIYSHKSETKKTGMDLFHNAKAVRLRSHHDKYLLADEDQDSVSQDRSGSSKRARWYVEIVSGTDNIIRLKSCYGRYLTASNQPFLLGMTGRKVLQTLPSRLDSSLEWEPVREGDRIKLRTRYGNFLRGNGGVPPWRNSVTHDIPNRSSTKDWICWEVHVVEIVEHSSHGNPPPPISDTTVSSETSSPSTCSTKSQSFGRQESSDSLAYSPPKASGGRTIYYHVADDNGNLENEDEGLYITFKGNGVNELTRTLEEETGLEGIIVCTKSPLNGNLYPLRLQLPPNNMTMNVVVVLSSSKVARGFSKAGIQ